MIVYAYAAAEDEIVDKTAALRARAMQEASAADDAIPGMTDKVKGAIRELYILANERESHRGVAGQFVTVQDTADSEAAVENALDELAFGGVKDELDKMKDLVLETLGATLNDIHARELRCVDIIVGAIALQDRQQLFDNHPELDLAASNLILCHKAARKTKGRQ